MFGEQPLLYKTPGLRPALVKSVGTLEPSGLPLSWLPSVLPTPVHMQGKPMMLWAEAGFPLASRKQRWCWIGGGNHRLVVGLARGRRGGSKAGFRVAAS